MVFIQLIIDGGTVSFSGILPEAGNLSLAFVICGNGISMFPLPDDRSDKRGGCVATVLPDLRNLTCKDKYEMKYSFTVISAIGTFESRILVINFRK